MTTKTITLATGQQITMRRPSEEEVLAYLDKRALLAQGERPSLSEIDDGDLELAACVTSPPRAELDELLEEYPLINRRLRDVFFELAGADRAFRRADDLITDEYRAPGRRLVAFVVDPQPAPAAEKEEAPEDHAARMAAWEAGEREKLIVLQKISRYEMKALEDEVREQGRKGPLPSAMAKLAKAHVALRRGKDSAEQLRDRLAEIPLLLANLGQGLYNAAGVKLQEDLGK